jgi:hypothetical protein
MLQTNRLKKVYDDPSLKNIRRIDDGVNWIE